MKLKEYLTKSDITQAQFGRKTGISVAALSQYITGKAVPSLQTAVKIWKATKRKVRPEEWIDETSDDKRFL